MSASKPMHQPLIDRRFKNINIDGQILSYTAKVPGVVGLFVDIKYVNVGDNFEIEILSIGREGSIAVGVVTEDNTDSRLPGLHKHVNTAAFHSDGNNCHGDLVVVFTHNGRKISTFCMDGEYFSVGMQSEEDIVKVITAI